MSLLGELFPPDYCKGLSEEQVKRVFSGAGSALAPAASFVPKNGAKAQISDDNAPGGGKVGSFSGDVKFGFPGDHRVF